MIEKVTDLWTEPCDARCITTNGFVKHNGHLVMGAGVAGQAQSRYGSFPKVAGNAVSHYGNNVHAFVFPNQGVGSRVDPHKTSHGTFGSNWFISFPVKHKWYEEADLELIKRSAEQLIELLDEPAFSPLFKKVLLPLPGCGNGKLSWVDVKPVIEPILDDRVWVINNKPFDWPASF